MVPLSLSLLSMLEGVTASYICTGSSTESKNVAQVSNQGRKFFHVYIVLYSPSTSVLYCYIDRFLDILDENTKLPLYIVLFLQTSELKNKLHTYIIQ